MNSRRIDLLEYVEDLEIEMSNQMRPDVYKDINNLALWMRLTTSTSKSLVRSSKESRRGE